MQRRSNVHSRMWLKAKAQRRCSACQRHPSFPIAEALDVPVSKLFEDRSKKRPGAAVSSRSRTDICIFCTNRFARATYTEFLSHAAEKNEPPCRKGEPGVSSKPRTPCTENFRTAGRPDPAYANAKKRPGLTPCSQPRAKTCANVKLSFEPQKDTLLISPFL